MALTIQDTDDRLNITFDDAVGTTNAAWVFTEMRAAVVRSRARDVEISLKDVEITAACMDVLLQLRPEVEGLGKVLRIKSSHELPPRLTRVFGENAVSESGPSENAAPSVGEREGRLTGGDAEAVQ
jgi:hypothetical protein